MVVAQVVSVCWALRLGVCRGLRTRCRYLRVTVNYDCLQVG